ncbi:MAG: hypothetical protein ABIJ34_08425 [archaeon]
MFVYIINTAVITFFAKKFKASGWPLFIWATILYIGATVKLNGIVLVDMLLVPISDSVLRYDQVMHIYGSAALYVFLHSIIKNKLSKGLTGAILFFSVLGVGSFNEVIEYTLIPFGLPIGDWLNMVLDMASNIIGAIIGAAFVYFASKKGLPK